jgi:hypothetical protein
LKDRAAGDGQKLAEEPEKQMPTFVDGDENYIDHQKRAGTASSLIEKKQIEGNGDG